MIGELLISDGRGPTRACRLPDEGVLTVGRDPVCDVHLEHEDVSRRHAIVRAHCGNRTFVDQSSNGSYVDANYLRNQEMCLPAECTIRIGPFSLRITSSQAASPEGCDFDLALRRRVHDRLLDSLELGQVPLDKLDRNSMERDVVASLERLLRAEGVAEPERGRMVRELTHEVFGLGPLEELLSDPEVSEVMVVDPTTIFCERRGIIERTTSRFTRPESCQAAIERILTPLGRRIDASHPYVDARLSDGSRVNAIIPPLALRGPCITIRKFSRERLELRDLERFSSLSPAMGRFLTRSVFARKNIVVSGGTGSGKTTLLNVLSRAIPENERIVTIEDAAELSLAQEHVVSLESRPANMEGAGAVSIRDLVRNALRMRPDRILVGECRGPEALDMLQAMNTGHDGSMTTVHASSPIEAMARIETLVLLAGVEIPVTAIRQQIASSLDLVVQQARFADGTRRITHITQVVGLSDRGVLELADIYRFDPGTERFRTTGHVPSFLRKFVELGLVANGEDYL